MKKKGVRKLRVSRETLRDLTSADAGQVVGGSDENMSCQSAICPTRTESDPGLVASCC